MKTFVALALFVTVSQAAVLCPKDACSTVRCAAQTDETCSANGAKLKPKGGWCGCCDICVSQLQEGDDCSALFLLGATQTSECTGDLTCDSTSKQCIKPNCSMKKAAMEKLVSELPVKPLGYEAPICSDDGSYAGKQCSGSQCYCVDTDGTSLGYEHNRWETDDKVMCQCARDKYNYFKLGIIGRLFHCSDKGDYHPVQCHGSVCYCADRLTGKQLDGTGVHVSAMESLNC